MLIMLPFSLLG